MKLSKLIKHLQAKLEEFGDMDCYTGGEHGRNGYEEISGRKSQKGGNLFFGSACAIIDVNDFPKEKDDSDYICYIGGLG